MNDKKKKSQQQKKENKKQALVVVFFSLLLLVLSFFILYRTMQASSLSLMPGATLRGNRSSYRRPRNGQNNGINNGGRHGASVVAIAAVAASVSSASASSSSRGPVPKYLDQPGRAAKLRKLLAKPGILVVSGSSFFFFGKFRMFALGQRGRS